MPKGNKGKGRQKKGGGGNKKKKGNRSARGNGSAGSAAVSSESDISPSSLLKGVVPDFPQNRASVHENYPSLYSRYKAATRRFLQYMRGNVPESVLGGNRSVNFLLTAADWLVEDNHTMDIVALRDLKMCIRMRSRVAKSVFGGGDAGHRYFLDVLVYCWSVLQVLPKSKILVESSDEEAVKENRFAILEEEDDEEEDEDIFPSRPVPRPDAIEKPMTVEELMASEDRTDAVIFLLTLDELMHAVANQYNVVSDNFRHNKRDWVPDSSIIYHLLEASVTANMAMQQVQQLEMELEAQHEHLSTPYRVLATLVMPEITTNVARIMREHAAQRCREQQIVAFLGDCIECFFRNPSDEYNKRDLLVNEFCTQYQVDNAGVAEIEKVFQGVEKLVVLEVPLNPERAGSNQLRALVASTTGLSGDSHSWLQNMSFVGGDRAIHHTLRLLQMFASVIDSTPQSRKIIPKRGYFGQSPWIAGRSRTIHGDLDELLMSDLLPDWVSLCRYGIVGKAKLPHENELCPLLVLLREYVNNPGRPVTWSLAFGVHATLTGVLTVNRDLYEISNISKEVFSRYFNQIKWAAKQAKVEEEMKKSPAWEHNIVTISFLENFGLAAYEDRAIWNPLFSGTIFGILSHFGNLEGGTAVVDCQAQLRICLYLYHALLVNGIIDEGDVPLLDILYGAFKSCKAVWGGSLPRRGELVQRFWLCFGASIKESKQMAEKAQLFVHGGRSTFDGFDEDAKSRCRQRKMTPIDPSEIATSFRRICERDFDDVCDTYHTPEQRRNAKDSEQYLFAVRTNDTLDAMEEEQTLLSINLVPCAYYLEQFVCSLGRVVQWEPLLKAFKRETNLPMRQGYAILFAQHLLAALDFSQDPLNHEFLRVPMGLAPSTFLKTFFERVPASNVLWFQAVQGTAQVHKTSLSPNFR